MKTSKMKLAFIISSCFLALISCKPGQIQISKEEEIINKSIENSGSSICESSIISFKFRDKEYVQEREGGQFKMKRIFEDSLGQIVDVYSNDSFTRTLNGELVEVADTMATKYENSINSVFYFALLPYKLNDEAVNKEYIGAIELKGKNYHKIKVYFDKEGGGKDYDDEFIYWINSDNYFIDYLAYSYSTDGGGMRFREAFNERVVEGIRFADYVNYKPKLKGSVELVNIDKAFEAGDLVELSKIELLNIKVEKK